MKFFTLRLELCDENYKSNWPDFMTDSQVRALADSFAEKGLLDAFHREFRNVPVAKENASFRSDYFKYYVETEEDINASPLFESVVLVDPAKTVQMQSDYSAIVGVSVNVVENKIYVRDIDAKRYFPDQLYDATFEMALRLGAKVIGLEVTSLHNFIVYPFKSAMLKKGLFFEVVELKAVKSKEERIGALVPFYRKGEVWHNKQACGPLENQLVWFPKSKRRDIMDALAYIVPLLEEGGRYFQPTAEQAASEFADLQYDKPLEVAWRLI